MLKHACFVSSVTDIWKFRTEVSRKRLQNSQWNQGICLSGAYLCDPWKPLTFSLSNLCRASPSYRRRRRHKVWVHLWRVAENIARVFKSDRRAFTGGVGWLAARVLNSVVNRTGGLSPEGWGGWHRFPTVHRILALLGETKHGRAVFRSSA